MALAQHRARAAMWWKRLASNLSRRAIYPLDARRGAGRRIMLGFYPVSSRWHFICGLLMIASGGLAAAIEPDALSSVATFVAWLLLASGAAELAASLTGRYSERAVDMILGTLSLAAGAELILMPPGSGFSFTTLITTWLLARASAELLAGLLASLKDEVLAAARLARAGVDLLLGLLCLIFSGTTGLVETLFGWPAISVRWVLLAAGASLIAAGGVHVAFAGRADRRPGNEGSG